jgi:hypothetical protein
LTNGGECAPIHHPDGSVGFGGAFPEKERRSRQTSGADRSSTNGAEKATNPLLAALG